VEIVQDVCLESLRHNVNCVRSLGKMIEEKMTG